MCIKKHLFAIVLTLVCMLSTYAQQQRTEVCIDFRLNSYTIDSTYMDNAARLQEIVRHIEHIKKDSTQKVIQLTFSGVASPEGNHQINKRLAKERLLTLERYVRARITLPDNLIIRHDDNYIPWHYLASMVKDSDMKQKEEILSILQTEGQLIPYSDGNTIDSRIVQLQQLDNGRVWQTLKSRYFAYMRNACAVFVTMQEFPQAVPVSPEETPVVAEVTLPEPVEEPMVDSVITPLPTEKATRSYYLKTNAIGWGLLISNIAIEADLAKHWSVTLPVYYSALNYMTSTIKFRALTIQPEVRYWFSQENKGWFGGTHLGLCWFNYAKNEELRYQDHEGKSPAWGGGFSFGYRMPISRNQRWSLEFALGAGIYDAHYDTFHNVPNGKKMGTHHTTFIGIDQAVVNLSYRFDIKKGKQ